MIFTHIVHGGYHTYIILFWCQDIGGNVCWNPVLHFCVFMCNIEGKCRKLFCVTIIMNTWMFHTILVMNMILYLSSVFTSSFSALLFTKNNFSAWGIEWLCSKNNLTNFTSLCWYGNWKLIVRYFHSDNIGCHH